MKKLLGTVVLGLLLSGNAYASCSNFLDFSWKYIGKDRITHVKKERAHYAKFTFKSSSDKSIQITSTRLFTVTDQLVKKDQLDNFVIKPFGKSSDLMYGMRDLNLDVVKTGGYSCRFYSPTNTSTTKKKTNNNKSKKTEENAGLVILFVFAVIGYFIYKFSTSKNPEGGFSSGSRSSSTKETSTPDIPKTKSNPKKSTSKQIKSNSVDVVSIKEFNNKIKSYIPSDQISQLPAIGDVEGQVFECGCGNSHIMNFDEHYFIADGGFYKAVFLSPQCKYLNALKLKGPMTSGIKNLCSTKYLSDKKNYGFEDYPNFAGAIDKFFIR